MSAKFLAIIVVYGSQPTDTRSLRSLARGRTSRYGLRIVVWDNSPQPHDIDWTSVGQAGTYVSTPQNLGLSTIYNRVITEHLRPGEHLLLLDQDTELPPDYLEKATLALEAHPEVDLFLPMVRASDRWASPVTYFCGWGRQWHSRTVGVIASKRVCAINSGMIISSAYLFGSFPGYDERLRFYGTDTQFMLDYMDRRSRLFVLDSVIAHDLSFFSGPRAQRAEKFAAMRDAYRYIYERRRRVQRIAVRIVMFAMSVRYAVEQMDPTFLRSASR
jgi:GT2 family glycosyltransferase